MKYITNILESCAAGSESKRGLYCETCAVDFYKSKNGGGKCVPCGKGTTTGGQLGQVQCKSKKKYVTIQ